MIKKLSPLLVLCIITASSFGQAQRLVLFEEFTGENCGPCAATNPYMDSLITACPNEVLWLRYQCNIPSPGYIYYQDANDVDNRMNYYGVSFAPWGEQDGVIWDSTLLSSSSDPQQPITWCTNEAQNPVTLSTDSSYLKAEYAVPSPFTIQVSHSFTATTDSFYATVVITAADSYQVSAPGNLRLQVAMVEDLNFATPPGDNGETWFPHVVRHMYPSTSGTTLQDAWISGNTQTFNFSGLTPNIIKDKTKVRFVAFIQDNNNMHVQQSGISAPVTFALDAASLSVPGNFIQCSANFTPSFTFMNNGTATLTSGTIQTLVDGASMGSHAWSGNLLPGDSASVTLGQVTLTSGVHTLSFIFNNPNNGVDANIGNDTSYLTVALTTIPPETTPLIDGFENSIDPGWLVDGAIPFWSRYPVGDSSNNSYQMDFFSAPYGSVNNLYAPAFTLAGFTSATLKFDRAYAQYNPGSTPYPDDSLYIEVSTDCGNTWTNVYSNGGATMATAPADADGNNPFVPTSGQWAQDSANLSAVAGSPDVLLRFKGVSQYGDDLYIDNVNISGFPVTGIIGVNKNLNSINLYPNPASNLLNVSLQLNQPAGIIYNVTDATGQVLINGNADIQGSGANNFSVNTSTLPDGLYLLSLTSGDEKISRVFGITR